MPDQELRLGDAIEVEIIGPSDDGSRLYTAAAVEPDRASHWTVVVRDRFARLLGKGDRLSGWVFSIDPEESRLFVSGDDFGRMPVSDRMRPRYLSAIRTVLTKAPDVPADAEAVSEVQGLFGRVVRRDQWDWFTVYDALGRPAAEDARSLWQGVRRLGRSLRGGDGSAAAEAWSRLRTLGLVEYLENAEQVLAAGPASQLRLPDVVPDSRTSAKLAALPEELHGTVVLDGVTRAKHERASKAHEQLLASARRVLAECGVVPLETPLIDLYCFVEGSARLFEAKTTTASNYKGQIRKALGQLLEYRFLYDVPDAELFLLLDRSPPQAWVIEFLASQGVGSLWSSEGGFAGPDAGRALAGATS